MLLALTFPLPIDKVTLPLLSTIYRTGATASKIPPNNPNNPFDLTSAIVVSGLASLSTQRPTDPATPYVVSYDVQDSASPPNKAITTRRRVQVRTLISGLVFRNPLSFPSQVVCPLGEIMCPVNDDGTLSCSTFGGSCAFSGTNVVSSPTPQISATTTLEVGSSTTASGPSILPSASVAASSGQKTSASAQSSSSDAAQQATAAPAIPSIR